MNFSSPVQTEQVEFLQHLLTQLKNETMDPGTKRRLGEFMMTESMCRNLSTTPGEDQKWLKYFTLGWYIYEMLGIEGS